MKIDHKTSIKKKILLVVFGFFLCLVVLEVGLRMAGFVYLAMQNHRNERSIKNNGEFRILCLGESTTAMGGKFSYPRQLENILNQQNIGIKFRVINKGIPGINTIDILGRLEKNLKKYKPHMVITMMGINDEGSRFICKKKDVSISNILVLLKSFRVYKLANFLYSYILGTIQERSLGFSEIKNNIFLDTNAVIRLMQEDNYKKREMSLKNLGELSSENVEGYIELGDLYLAKEEGKKAIEVFNKIIEFNPENIVAYKHLVFWYTSQDNFKKAEEILDKALKTYLIDVEQYVELGILFSALDRYKEAEEIFNQVIENDFRNVDAYIELNWLYEKQKKYDQAEEILKQGIVINPRNDQMYSRLIQYYCTQREYDKAQLVFKKAVKINSKNDTAYERFVECFKYQGNISGVEKLLNKSVWANPKNDEAYVELGMHYRRQKEYYEAEKMLKKAIEINPYNNRAYEEILVLLHERKMREKYRDLIMKHGLVMKHGLERESCRTITQHNYQKLKQMVIRRWIPLIAVQYPMRNLEMLKQVFENQDDVIFVDNEQTFKEAVRQGGYDAYFADKFAGNFGHATKKGNRLLAENIASMLLRSSLTESRGNNRLK